MLPNRGRRTPDRPVQVMIQAERHHLHAPLVHCDPFGLEPPALLAESGRTDRDADSPVGAQYAVPWQVGTIRRITQDAADQPGPARVAGAGGNGPVTGDAPTGNGGHGLDDPPGADGTGVV